MADVAPQLESGGGGGGGSYGGGGMDPWQQSVEKRLDSLDRRLSTIEGTVTDTRVDVATIKVDVTYLPTKSWIGKRLYTGLAVAALLTGALANIPRIIDYFSGAPASQTQIEKH